MSIKFRVYSLLGVFFTVILVNVIVVSMMAGVQHKNAALNTAGGLRMLSQKIMKEALLINEGAGGGEDFEKSKKRFETNLSALINGNESMDISPADDEDLISQLQKINSVWSKFEKNLSEALQPGSSVSMVSVSATSNDLLREANRATVMIEESTKSFVSGLRNVVFAFVLFSIGAVIVGVWYLNHFVVSRIVRIQHVSEEIASTKDLSKRINMQENDEIGATAQAFDKMIDSFMQLNSETQGLEKELQKQLEMLAITTEENTSSMDMQRNDIIHVSTAVNEMASTVQEVARNTQEASNVATRAQEEADHGSKLLEESMKLTHDLANEILGAAENIEKLAQASDSIGGIADTITTIAEQTNLLALNAAIEAARAGEQGRGFAVVADEVRTLAKRTQEATSEIHKLIATLQQTTEASVETMENSKTRSEQGVHQAASMAESLTAIIGSVQNLSDINHQIAVAAEEQSAVADDINNNILKIESKAENTYSNAQATATYSQNLAAMASQLRERLLEYTI
ncbi:MAG: methyl-accepting chemotaxis protein [Agarilytica sp.]